MGATEGFMWPTHGAESLFTVFTDLPHDITACSWGFPLCLTRFAILTEPVVTPSAELGPSPWLSKRVLRVSLALAAHTGVLEDEFYCMQS